MTYKSAMAALSFAMDVLVVSARFVFWATAAVAALHFAVKYW